MSLLTNLQLEQIAPGRARASWTGSSAALASHVFVDGFAAALDVLTSAAARTLSLQWDADATKHIEIHELAVGVTAGAEAPVPNRRPTISWTPLSTAQRYRIYLNDVLSSVVPHDSNAGRMTAPCPKTLSAGWNEVRVEAVDAYGNESTRANWWYFTFAPLPAPSAVAVSGTGPYTFTITA